MEIVIQMGDIIRQFEIDDKFLAYKETLERSRYLSNIDEELIYKLYKFVIQKDNFRDFPADFK